MEEKKKAKVYGKVINLPDNTDVVKFMDNNNENIKIPRNKHWYLLTEKEKDQTGKEIHLVKWNQEGINANVFIAQLKEFYLKTIKDEKIKTLFENIKVSGNDKFSIISNIPDIEIVDSIKEGNKTIEVKKTLVAKITSDLIKLLRN